MEGDVRECWQDVSLGDLIDVRHGFAFRGEHFSDTPTPDVLVTPGSFRIGGGFDGSKSKYYHGPVDAPYVLPAGTLLITMTDLSRATDTLGAAAVVPFSEGLRYLHNQRIGRVEIRRGAPLDEAFLYAVLRSDRYRRQVVSTATGSTVHHTSPGRITTAKIPLPPLAHQRAIASVIGALDDKMESNPRLAATAEAAAACACDGVATFARTPPRWTSMAFSAAVEVNPRVRVPKGTDTPFVEMAAVAPFATRPQSLARRAFVGGAKFEPGDTLMARITGCIENGKGAFADFVDEPSAGSTEFVVFRAKSPLSPEAVFALSRDPALRAHAIANMIGTSGRQRVDNACWGTIDVALAPPSAEREDAIRLMADCMRMGRGLWAESRTLTAIRDALLPKLVSGQIRVPLSDDPAESLGAAIEALNDAAS